MRSRSSPCPTYRKLSARALLAKENIRQRITCLLSLVPRLQNRRDLISPWHRHRRARLVDNNRVGVGCKDGLDEPILAPVERQVHRLPIVALRLPLGINAHNDDRHVGSTGCRHGLLQVVDLVLLLEANAAAAVPVGRVELFLLAGRAQLVGHADFQLHRLTSLHVHINEVVDRAVEHGLAFLSPIPQIQNFFPVHVQATRPDTHIAESVLAGRCRLEVGRRNGGPLGADLGHGR